MSRPASLSFGRSVWIVGARDELMLESTRELRVRRPFDRNGVGGPRSCLGAVANSARSIARVLGAEMDPSAAYVEVIHSEVWRSAAKPTYYRGS